MPIVGENKGGLKRYAVFTFVEDQTPGNPGSTALRFPMSPHCSSLEPSTKLAHTEMFHMKRLKSLEKGVFFPYVDVTFYSSYQNVDEMRNLLEPSDCINLHDHNIKLQKGCFEEVQLVDPKRDMILTPIDIDDVITERLLGKGVTSQNKVPKSASETEAEEDFKKTRGYIVIAYKTMENMYSRDFVSSWKTWTGVRYICMQMPRQLGLRRIAFYRQISTTSDFTYVLLIEIMNLLVYAAQTLNLMDGIKLRLCGYTGIYREMDYQVDLATAAVHRIETKYRPPDHSYDAPKINVSRHDSNDSSIDSRKQSEDKIGGLAELFQKQNEIANKRRQDREMAEKIEEQRRAKLFKLFGGRRDSAVPDYAPPPPPDVKVPEKIEEICTAPKASPESEPDLSPPPSPVHKKKDMAIALPNKQTTDYMKQKAITSSDMGAVHGEFLPEKKSSPPKYLTPMPVIDKPAALDYYIPMEQTLRPQVVFSSKMNSQQRAVAAVVPLLQQQLIYIQKSYPVSTKAESHRLPPPYGVYPPFHLQEAIEAHNNSNVTVTAALDRRRSDVELLLAGNDLARNFQEPLIQLELVQPQQSELGNTDQDYNSPIYTRNEWKQGSLLYPGGTTEEHMHHLARNFGSMQETAILTEESETEHKKDSVRKRVKNISKELAEAISRPVGSPIPRGSRREKSSRAQQQQQQQQQAAQQQAQLLQMERDRSHSYGSADKAEKLDAYNENLAARRQVYFQLQERSRSFLENYPLETHRKSMPGSTHELLLALENGEIEAQFKAARKKHKERPQEPVNLRDRPDIVKKIEPAKDTESKHQRLQSPRRLRALPRIPVLADSPSPPVQRQQRKMPQVHQSRSHEKTISVDVDSTDRSRNAKQELRRPTEIKQPTTVTRRSAAASSSSKSSERRQLPETSLKRPQRLHGSRSPLGRKEEG